MHFEKPFLYVGEFGEPETLAVEDPRFSIVPEWVIDAELSDGAFRLYTLLLRYGNSSGRRMPSRALLARRLHRSVDSVDRSLRELASAGVVQVEHRRAGRAASHEPVLRPHVAATLNAYGQLSG